MLTDAFSEKERTKGAMAAGLCGVVFDKDGTLFDFRATWVPWCQRLLCELAAGDGGLERALADAIKFDLLTGAFASDSPVIAHTPPEIAEILLPLLPDWRAADLVDHMNRSSGDVPQVETVPLRAYLSGLQRRGLALGVVTNDAEAPARLHLGRAGVADLFDVILGSDSGPAPKPSPAPLLAFCAATGCRPDGVVMVGDSGHDMAAARAAGMRAVAVLTGTATSADLAPLADVVLPDIGGLSAWLDAQG